MPHHTNDRSVMRKLNFPDYPFVVDRDDLGQLIIFDEIRKKPLRLTPEEWVRQHLVKYLISDLHYPSGYAVLEKGFRYGGTPVRADVIMHDRTGKPFLMAECKAPEVKITEAVFEQLSRYNAVINAVYLVATNGLQHYCCSQEGDSQGFVFLPEIPEFSD
jgi:hypothetical protein